MIFPLCLLSAWLRARWCVEPTWILVQVGVEIFKIQVPEQLCEVLTECSKMQLCGHREKAETVNGTVPVRVFYMCGTNFMYPKNHVCEDIVLA